MTVEDEVAEWSRACRGCLSKATLVPIFDGRDDIKTKFFESTSIIVSEDDGLPAYMCLDCLDTLNYAHQFKKRCLKIDTELKQKQAETQKIDSQMFKANTGNGNDSNTDINEKMSKIVKGKNFVSPVKLEGLSKIDSEEDCYYVVIINEENGEKIVQAVKIEADNEDEQMQEVAIKDIKKEVPEYNLEDTEEDVEHQYEEMIVPILEEAEDSNQEQILMDETITMETNIEVDENSISVTEEESQNSENIELQEIPIDVNIAEDNQIDNVDQRRLNLIHVLTGNDEDGNLIHYAEEGVSLVGEVITGDLAIAEDGTTYAQEEVIVGDGEYQIVTNGMEIPLMFEEEQETITVMQQEDGSFLCDCGEAYMEFADYENHIKIHNTYNCATCNKGFESKEILEGHMLMHTSAESLLECPFCSQRIKRNMLITHIKINHNHLRPVCNVCKKSFANEHNLKRHMLIHSGIKQYECEICHKCFNQKTSLQNHRLLHTDQTGNDLKCLLCSEQFETEQQIKEHHAEGCEAPSQDIKVNIEKPYTCETCGKHYATPGSLKSHIEYIHNNQPIELLCSECGEVLPSRKAMYAHAYTHRQVKMKNYKRFSCTVCGKGCASHAMLLMHERVHTNERPFQCPNCSLAFKTKTHLNTHQLTHTQEKRFGCSVCMKFFALKGNLVVHLRTHTGERPYVCSICDQAFIDSKYLKKHKQRRHNIANIPWNQYY